MKFRKKIKPKTGDKKVKVKFAWFPTKIDKTITIWLEFYAQKYEYIEYKETVPTNFTIWGIPLEAEIRTVIGWQETERELI